MSTRSRSISAAVAIVTVALTAPAGSAAADTIGQPRDVVEQTGDVYGFADFYGIPNLGEETARGTGCGGDGSVGPVIPDGWWRGYIRGIDAAGLDFDLVCVYGPNVNPDLISEWTAEHPGEALPWVPDGFMVNNNPRTRRVALSASFFTNGTAWSGTSCALDNRAVPFDQSRDTWIRIVGGQAQWAASSCAGVPGGGQPPSPPSGFTFPYATFYDVPRLGVEEVLGTGCGGNGTLGDTMPDGIWFGWVDALGPTSLEFDVACIYIGESAFRFETEWLNSPELQQEDPSPYFGGGGMWLVNNNERTRTVPLAPGFVVAVAFNTDPAVPDPNWPVIPGLEWACVPPVDPTIRPAFWSPEHVHLTGAWLMISGGQAQYILSECMHD